MPQTQLEEEEERVWTGQVDNLSHGRRYDLLESSLGRSWLHHLAT